MFHKQKWDLLSWWFKAIVILYILTSSLVLLALILTFLGIDTPLSIYGISTPSQFSTKGLLLLSIFILKGLVGYSFITGQSFAITVGIIDSLLGIVICLVTGFVLPFYSGSNSIDFVFRIELLILIPFLFSTHKLKNKWSGPF